MELLHSLGRGLLLTQNNAIWGAGYQTAFHMKTDVCFNLTISVCVSKSPRWWYNDLTSKNWYELCPEFGFGFCEWIISLECPKKHIQRCLCVFPVSTNSVTSGQNGSPCDCVSPGECSHYCGVVWQLNMETLFALVKYFLVLPPSSLALCSYRFYKV